MSPVKTLSKHPHARPVFIIGKLTFAGMLREKLLWSAFVFIILCLGLSVAISKLNFAEQSRVILDFGLTAISIVGGVMAIILGSSMISHEVDDRTAYLLVSKPLKRWQYILGKFTGVFMVLVVNSLLLFLFLLVIYLFNDGELRISLFQTLFLQFLEFGILIAIANIFSSFSTTAFAAAVSSGVWVIGHAMKDLKLVIDKVEPVWFRPPLNTIAMALPDLSGLNLKSFAAHGIVVEWSYIFSHTLYALLYILFALTLTCTIFSRRDI